MPGKKPKKFQPYCCSNKLCQKSFNTIRSLNMHLAKSNECKLNLSNLVLNPNNDQEEVLVDNDTVLTEDDFGETFFDTNNEDQVSIQEELPSTLHGGMQHTDEQYFEVKLLQILNDAHAQHFLFEQIMTWAREALENNYKFLPKQKDRETYMKNLAANLNMNGLRPEKVPITLPGDNKQIQLVRFQFRHMLESLLTDPDLVGDLSNLDVNPDNPFGMYKSPNNVLSCVNSGTWYRRAYKHLVKDPKKDFLCPIIMASDEAKLKQGGKAGAWPLDFTLSIFNQSLRNLPFAWRPLGYVYDLSIIESQAESKQHGRDLKCERLHTMFRAILATLVEIQREGGIKDIPVTLGNITKRVNILVPVTFIIGDIQGGDKLCCRAPTYVNTVNRICRKCDCRGNQSSDPLVGCMKISQVKVIQALDNNEVETLQEFNQYNVRSAFFDLCYGGCKYGIFSAACPIEPLHALENGLMNDAIKILFEEYLQPKDCKRLDEIVRKLTTLERQKYLSSGSDKEMPRLLWQCGVTTLTDLTAAQKVGILMTITVVALTEEGSNFFKEVLKEDATASMIEVFQMLLTYWMWLKKTHYWKRNDENERVTAKLSIRLMMQKLISLWPRAKGNGWEKPKMHEQLHVPDDIERNGAPRNYHSGPSENHHIHNLKNLAKTTQGRRTVLDWQIGQRYFETHIINYALRRMETKSVNQDCNIETDEDTVQADNYHDDRFQGACAHLLILKGEGKTNVVEIKWRNNQEFELSPLAISFLAENYVPGTRLKIYTEYKRSGKVFRAHPCYNTTGRPWYDWAIFRWSPDNPNDKNLQQPECMAGYGDDPLLQKKHLYAPGQLLAFVEEEDGKRLAIARACGYQNSRYDIIFTKWKQEYVYSGRQKKSSIQAVDVNSLVRHCLMIPYNDEREEYIEVWSRELWADQFLDPTVIKIEGNTNNTKSRKRKCQ